ncbi:hypothetical protein [Devosia sp. 1635]|uniref:hypothetical protein n=1 Tax=Devosia sp. 1635 TaxID=2726066 RepID=UPI001566E0F2|nr:hypothetical protein [Devosia sp. 1635]
MTFPDHTDPCWQSADWRTETLLALMKTYRLSISAVCDLTDTKYSTVACWRKSVDRPISIAHLKALMFELGRGLV